MVLCHMEAAYLIYISVEPRIYSDLHDSTYFCKLSRVGCSHNSPDFDFGVFPYLDRPSQLIGAPLTYLARVLIFTLEFALGFETIELEGT